MLLSPSRLRLMRLCEDARSNTVSCVDMVGSGAKPNFSRRTQFRGGGLAYRSAKLLYTSNPVSARMGDTAATYGNRTVHEPNEPN